MTPPQEERLTAVETRMIDHIDAYHRHAITCVAWQADMNRKLDAIYAELNNRLPRWASVGGIVTFSLLTGVLGWLIKAQGI